MQTTNIVQQRVLPAPGKRRLDKSRAENESYDKEVLEELWIKPEDMDLQWKMDKLNREETTTELRRLKTYSETYLSRKMKLLGHVVRAGNEDPMRQVTFEEGCVKEPKVGTRRVGKPKLDWVRQGKIQVWKKTREN